jgi:hypothetical protein
VGEPTLAHEPADELVVEVIFPKAEGLFDLVEAPSADALGFFRIKLFGDVGPFGPGPEFIIGLLPGALCFEVEPHAFDGEALGMEVVATETVDIRIELVQEIQTRFEIGFTGEDGAGGGSEMNGGPLGDFVVEAVGQERVTEGGLIGEAVDDAECILAEAPVVVTAVLPFCEIAGSDGPAVEMFAEDCLNFGKGVQPIENGIGWLAVMEPLIDFVAEGVRETGEFAGTGGMR